MSDLFAWANSQPVWLQVLFGLLLFFFGLPLLTVALYGALRLLHAFLVAALVVGAICLVAYLAWLAAGAFAEYISYFVGSSLSLPYRRYEAVRQYAFVMVLGLEAVGVSILLWFAVRRRRRLGLSPTMPSISGGKDTKEQKHIDERRDAL